MACKNKKNRFNRDEIIESKKINLDDFKKFDWESGPQYILRMLALHKKLTIFELAPVINYSDQHVVWIYRNSLLKNRQHEFKKRDCSFNAEMVKETARRKKAVKDLLEIEPTLNGRMIAKRLGYTFKQVEYVKFLLMLEGYVFQSMEIRADHEVELEKTVLLEIKKDPIAKLAVIAERAGTTYESVRNYQQKFERAGKVLPTRQRLHNDIANKLIAQLNFLPPNIKSITTMTKIMGLSKNRLYESFIRLKNKGVAMFQGRNLVDVLRDRHKQMVSRLYCQNPMITVDTMSSILGLSIVDVKNHLESINRQLNEADARRVNAVREFLIQECFTDMEHCDDMMEKLKKYHKGIGWMDSKTKVRDALVRMLGIEAPKELNVNHGMQKSKGDRDAVMSAFKEAKGFERKKIITERYAEPMDNVYEGETIDV